MLSLLPFENVLPENVPRGQGGDIVLFDEPRGQGALPSSRLAKHDHSQRLPVSPGLSALILCPGGIEEQGTRGNGRGDRPAESKRRRMAAFG